MKFGGDSPELDAIDLQIIALLQEHGRIPLVKLGEQVGLSAPSVNERVKKLEDGGVIVNPVTPRNVIKEAFAAKIVADGQVWIDMMLDRNRLSHTYDFQTFTSVLEAVVKRYFPALDALHEWLVARSVQP